MKISPKMKEESTQCLHSSCTCSGILPAYSLKKLFLFILECVTCHHKRIHRVKELLEVSANNAEAVVEHPDYESNPSPSGSAVGTPASVRSLPSGHTPDDLQPHPLMTQPTISTSEQTSEQSHTVPTRRQQSSPAKLFADPQQPAQECIPTVAEATVSSSTKGEKATKDELIRALREENLTAIVEKIA